MNLTRRQALFFAAAPEQDVLLKSHADLVVLDVLVEDRTGKAVRGLPASSFQVWEEGRQRPVKYFAPQEEEPVAAGLVLDMSRSMAPRLASLRMAVRSFLGASDPRNEYFTVAFNDTVRLISAASFDGLAAIGRTSLYDGLLRALDHVTRSRLERRVLLLVSDGRDTASRATKREVWERLLSSPATVHTIGLFDEDEDPREHDGGSLQKIASLTGGLHAHPLTPAALDDFCVRVARDIRARYTLTYTPAAEGPPVRRIKVKVTNSASARIRTRTQVKVRA